MFRTAISRYESERGKNMKQKNSLQRASSLAVLFVVLCLCMSMATLVIDFGFLPIGAALASSEELPSSEQVPDKPLLMGDVNNDRVVDGRDVLHLAKYMAGQNVTINEKASDLTGNGAVDGRDVLRLAKRLAGK